MKLISCEHPITFVNHLGQKVTVPCGKCALCRNKVSHSWVQKIQSEFQCWQYCFFVTLTYDNEHLPLVEYDSISNTLSNDSLGVSLERELSVKERFYIKKRGYKMSFPYTRDYQLFIKRLRYYFYEYNKQNNNNSPLRYFISTEYGPTSHRIHAHGLIFFNDRTNQFAGKFAEYCNKSWKNGNIVSELVSTSKDTAKYVAKYVNADFNRFSLFKTSLLRPKIYFSKSPAIGSLLFDDRYIRTIFNQAAVVYRLQLSDKFQDVPLPYSIKNRLFPRVPKFNQLNCVQRIGIYSISKWSECKNVSEFLEWLDNQPTLKFSHRYGRYVDLSDNAEVLGFHDNGFPIFDPVGRFYIDNPVQPLISYLNSLIDYSLKDPFYNVKYVWRISRRVLTQAAVFGVSLRDYLKQIDKYYSNVELYKLKKWYIAQEDLSRKVPHYPVGCFVYLDTQFVTEFLKYDTIESVPYWIMSTFWGYGINPYKFYSDKAYRLSFLPDNFSEVKDFINHVHFSYLETHKLKQKKDYLRLHPEYSFLQRFNFNDL